MNKHSRQPSFSCLENLESRLLMAAPTFLTDPANVVFDSTGGLAVPIDADDADGDALTIGATIDNANFTVVVPTGDRFARLYFRAPQIWRGTIGSNTANQTFSLQVVDAVAGTNTITYTAAANATTTTIATGLAAAWNAAGNPLSTSIVAVTDGAKVYLYHKDTSRTFTVTTGGTGTWNDGAVVQNPYSGSILVQVYTTRQYAKLAAERFLTLSANKVNSNGTLDPNGTPFYTNVPVHRIIDNFMMQTGDATNGNGTGDSPLPDLPGTFDPHLSYAGRGVLAMARAGVDTSNSQFFITDQASAASLDHNYIIFGQVISGWDVYEKIITAPVMSNGQEISKPISAPLLDHVEVLATNNADAKQAGTVWIFPKNNYVGTANLTITLNDGQNTVQRVVTVKASGFAQPADVTLAPGGQTTFNINKLADTRTGTLSVASKGLSTATVTVNSGTGEVTVKVPDGYLGSFPVTLSLSFTADAVNHLPAGSVTRTFYVHSRNAADPTYSGSIPEEFNEPDTVSSTYQREPNIALGTVVIGNRLYLAEHDQGIKIFDISDPTKPTLLAIIDTAGEAKQIEVAGNYVYAIEWGTNATANSFAAYDISDLNNIRLASRISSHTKTLPLGMAIRDNVAYVTEYDFDGDDPNDANPDTNRGGLVTYDISNPSNIRQLDQFLTVNPFLAITAPADVALHGNYAYVSDLRGVLFVLNVANPASIRYVSYTYTPGTAPWGMQVVGDKLYVADQGLGLMVYSVARSTPKLLGKQRIDGANAVAVTSFVADGVTKTYAVVSNYDGTALVDVTTPNRPALHYYHVPAAADVYTQYGSVGGLHLNAPAAVGSQAYLRTDNGTVVMDLTNLSDYLSTTKLVFTTPGGVTVTVSLKGDGAIVVPRTDVNAPINPTELQISGASSNTSVTITTSNGAIWSPDKITVTGEIGSFTALTTRADGYYFDGIGKLTLGDLPDGGTISLGSGYLASTVSLGNVQNLALSSNGYIKSLTVKQWLDPDATADSLTAKTCAKIVSKGDFAPDVTLSGGNGIGTVINSATVAGAVRNSLWKFTGAAASIAIKGTTETWELQATSVTKSTFGVVSGGSKLTLSGTAPSAVTAASWAGGTIQAKQLKTLKIPGAMSANLTINGTAGNMNLPSVTLGSVTGGTWTISGNAGKVSLASAAGWSPTFDNVASLAIKGSLTGTVVADSIATFTVGGDITDSTISLLNTPVPATPTLLTLGKMTVTGAIRNTNIRSKGHVGSITAGAFVRGADRGYIAVGLKDGVNSADAADDFLNTARLDAITIKGIKGLQYAYAGWVSAPSLGKVSLANADRATQTPLGIAGQAMTSYSYKDPQTTVKWTNAANALWPQGFNNYQIVHIV